jgi:hypothetical protein
MVSGCPGHLMVSGYWTSNGLSGLGHLMVSGPNKIVSKSKTGLAGFLTSDGLCVGGLDEVGGWWWCGWWN